MRPTFHRLIALPLAVLLAACPGDEDEDDDTDTVVDTDTQDTVDTDVEDTDVVDTDVVDTDAACWVDGDDGACWDCAPPAAPREDSLAFLNACDNASSSVRFDNATRIPSSTWTPGTPLPTIP